MCLKHVGKMKNNSARLVVVYRTLPGDPYSALVVGTQGLGDSYHDTLMNLVESEAAQSANELADILATRRFPDGAIMLEFLHTRQHLKKVPTNSVLMTPDSQSSISLDELNVMIAKQKGVSLEQLAVTEAGAEPAKIQTNSAKKEEKNAEKAPETKEFTLTPAELRSRADALFKQAQQLRKQADELDPPKKKTKSEVAQ